MVQKRSEAAKTSFIFGFRADTSVRRHVGADTSVRREEEEEGTEPDTKLYLCRREQLLLDCGWALFGNRASGKRPREGHSVY